jgi:sec-independent protein translocase protein TatB
MFNIGAGEMVVILVAALLILGPQRLPEMARAIGKFMREFRRQTDEVRNVVEREFYAMDQDLEREPQRPVRAPDISPTSLPAMEPLPSLPPAGPVATLEGAPAPAEPAVPAPNVVATEPQAMPSAEPSAGTPLTDADGLPRLAPIPGTVARNAPKPS